VCSGPEEFKAWSQNLGHDHVMTTFASHGQVASHRQAEIMRGLGKPRVADDDLQAGLVALLEAKGLELQPSPRA
jgi:hypothetical protein